MFNYSYITLNAQTNPQGIAQLGLMIPGTFGKLIAANRIDLTAIFGASNSGKTEGRWLDLVVAWPDNLVPGDRLSKAQLTDPNGVVPLAARPRFSDYPLIYNFFERRGADTARIQKGLQFPPNQPLSFKPRSAPIFLPAGMRLEIEFTAALPLAGRIVRANISYGHMGVD